MLYEVITSGDAAELGTAEGRHMAPAVFVQPRRRALVGDDGGDRIDAAGQPLAGDDDIGLEVVVLVAPQASGPSQALV